MGYSIYFSLCYFIRTRVEGKRGKLQTIERTTDFSFIRKAKNLELQQCLEQQINSQSDLAWLELTLMKGLGLVPENDQKVFFYQDQSENFEKGSTGF